MSLAIESIQNLVKALEAGSYDVAPSRLNQGAALQIEDLSNVMNVVTFEEKHLKLQKELKTSSCKSTLAQFDRQLSYGIMGGSAQLEGNVGQEETSQFVRVTVPMAYYSHTRRVTIASTMVATVDGQKSDERAAKDAAIKLAGDIEFDSFRGKADFSNAGVFDGSPLAIGASPNLMGVDAQVRMSDLERNAQDLMFAEFGSDQSVVLSGGSTLSQELVEDAWTRSQMNHGEAEDLLVDPLVLSNYNKLSITKERIILAGAPQEAHGASLRKQWTSGGMVDVQASRFLSGKTGPAQARSNGPAAVVAPTGATAVLTTTSFLLNQVYAYSVTAGNEIGESPRTNIVGNTVTIDVAGKAVLITIPATSGARYFNVYRSAAGGSAMKFVGRVAAAASGSTIFTDLNNKLPAFVTGFLIQKDTMEMKELAPYSRLKLAVSDLSNPEAHFRFCALCVEQPRKNVIIDSLR